MASIVSRKVSFAAAASVNNGAASGTNDGPTTFAAGDAAVIFTLLDKLGTTTGCSVGDGGTNTYPQSGSYVTGVTGILGIFVCQNMAAGTPTITVASNGTAPNGTAFWVYRVSGHDIAGVLTALTAAGNVQNPSVSGTDATTTDAGAPTAPTSLMIGACYNDLSSTLPAIGTGFSSPGALSIITNNLNGAVDEYKALSGTTPAAATFTFPNTSERTLSIGVIIPDVSAGGGGTCLADAEWHPLEQQTNPLTVSVW